ncbi:MAG: helix-turn-helix domain-containing protein [Actinomycetota bacterium]
MPYLDGSVEAKSADDVGIVTVGVLSVYADCSEAFCAGAPLALTFGQRRVLFELLRLDGRVARREDLYQSAFGRALPAGSRAVDIHVGRIRRALGRRADTLVSVGSVGYRLEPTRLRS